MGMVLPSKHHACMMDSMDNEFIIQAFLCS